MQLINMLIQISHFLF